jgi:hypothetical protein
LIWRSFRPVLFTVVSPNSLRFRCGILNENGSRSGDGLVQKAGTFEFDRTVRWFQTRICYRAYREPKVGEFSFGSQL